MIRISVNSYGLAVAYKWVVGGVGGLGASLPPAQGFAVCLGNLFISQFSPHFTYFIVFGVWLRQAGCRCTGKFWYINDQMS